MNEIKLGAVQEKFADIIWELEPVPSGQLVKVCAERLNWKKPTTYTVLRTLCEKGIFQELHRYLSYEQGGVSHQMQRAVR